MISVNEGARPSRLQLDRYATGELAPDEVAAVEAALDADANAHLARLDAAKAQVRPFDADALRRRAFTTTHAPPTALPRANQALWFLLAAAVALLVGLPLLRSADLIVPDGYVGVRGGGLAVFQLRDGALRPHDGGPVGEGDVLGFKVVPPADAHGVVLLSVDGVGRVSVFWPESGDDPEPLPADGALPGSIALDGAPGPEVFVAVFDTSADEATVAARRAWQDGGADGVLAWADGLPHADAVRLERR